MRLQTVRSAGCFADSSRDSMKSTKLMCDVLFEGMLIISATGLKLLVQHIRPTKLSVDFSDLLAYIIDRGESLLIHQLRTRPKDTAFCTFA